MLDGLLCGQKSGYTVLLRVIIRKVSGKWAQIVCNGQNSMERNRIMSDQGE